MRAFLALLLVIAFSQPALAGAWLKKKGGGFYSFGATVLLLKNETTPRLEQTAYFEYGIGEKLTLGASFTRIQDLSMQTLVFARVPVQSWDSGARLAAEFGLGQKEANALSAPFLSAGLSWGKGLSRNDKYGWVNIDTALQFDLDTGKLRLKIDATYGMDLTDNMRLLAQGFAELSDGANSLTLSPGLILKPKKLKFEPVLSLEHRIGARASSGLRIALWKSF